MFPFGVKMLKKHWKLPSPPPIFHHFRGPPTHDENARHQADPHREWLPKNEFPAGSSPTTVQNGACKEKVGWLDVCFCIWNWWVSQNIYIYTHIFFPCLEYLTSIETCRSEIKRLLNFNHPIISILHRDQWWFPTTFTLKNAVENKPCSFCLMI